MAYFFGIVVDFKDRASLPPLPEFLEYYNLIFKFDTNIYLLYNLLGKSEKVRKRKLI